MEWGLHRGAFGLHRAIKKNRKGSVVVHAAAGESDEETIFYANSRGSLSTLDKSQESRWKKDYSQYFHGFEEQKVRKARLDTIFKECEINEVDILSLDIEGYEVEATMGLNFNNTRPRVMLIESDSIIHEKKLDSEIMPAGYTKSIKYHGNIFYVREDEYDLKLRGAILNISLCNTAHPIDGGEDVMGEIKIDIPKYLASSDTGLGILMQNVLIKLKKLLKLF